MIVLFWLWQYWAAKSLEFTQKRRLLLDILKFDDSLIFEKVRNSFKNQLFYSNKLFWPIPSLKMNSWLNSKRENPQKVNEVVHYSDFIWQLISLWTLHSWLNLILFKLEQSRLKKLYFQRRIFVQKSFCIMKNRLFCKLFILWSFLLTINVFVLGNWIKFGESSVFCSETSSKQHLPIKFAFV